MHSTILLNETRVCHPHAILRYISPQISYLEREVDGDAAEGNETVEVVVVAADRAGGATARASANNGDRRAGDANEDIQAG